MQEKSHSNDLSLAQDLRLERRTWRVERVAWVIMAVITCAALAGLCGPGPLSRANVREPSAAFWLEYSRFARFKAPTTLRLHLGPTASQQGLVRIQLSRHYLETVHIEQITPQPLRAEAGDSVITYVVSVAEPGEPTSVTFSLKTERFGPQQGCARLAHGPALCFTQFVYP